MKAVEKACDETPPEYAYHLLRCALEQYGKKPSQLDQAQFKKVQKQADASFDLESRVLASAEASDVTISEQQVQEAVKELAGRYESHATFLADLVANNLDESLLYTALLRELTFSVVMERIGMRGEPISDLDIIQYYEAHPKQFMQAETRVARHILLTINPAFPDNTRQAAKSRIEHIAEILRNNPRRFADMARKHSECPSALEGGKLGCLSRGKLYPELDQALFELEQGYVSKVVETELGLHLIYCEKIYPAGQITLLQARSHIQQFMQQRQRHQFQRAFLAKLTKYAPKGTER